MYILLNNLTLKIAQEENKPSIIQLPIIEDNYCFLGINLHALMALLSVMTITTKLIYLQYLNNENLQRITLN